MKTKSLELYVLIIFLMFSCFLGIAPEACLKFADIDFWMIPIIATIIGFPVLLLYLYIFNNKKNLNINQLNEQLFGKFLGKGINIFLLAFVISFNLITFWNMVIFVSSQYLYDTPIWFVTLIFMLPVIYTIIKGPRVMFRSILMLFYIAIILYIISALGLTAQFKLTNLFPILENGIMPVFKGVYPYIAYVIAPLFLILIVPKSEIEGKSLSKGIIITYFIGSLMVFIIMTMVLGVFGYELTTLYHFPSYHILKRVFVGGFIERMENTLSIQWIIVLFITTLFSHYYTARSMKEIFNLKNKYILIIILAIMFLSQYIFKSNTFGEDFFINYYHYFIGIFFILVPIVIAGRLFYKKKTSKSSFQKVKN